MNIKIQTLLVLVLTAFISTAVAAENLTVADLLAKRVDLAGKQVTITGTVIKVNNGILHRNFVHVQDETGAGAGDHAIFTGQQKVEVGDKIAATGTVKLDIDFGAGYFYPMLIEEATFKPAN